MIRIMATGKRDDEDTSTTPCVDGNDASDDGWGFDEIELSEREEDSEDDENQSSEDESDEKENIASSPKGASLNSAKGILSPSSFEIRQNARRLLMDTSNRRRSKRRQSTSSVLRRPLQPSSVGNRMAANRDDSKGVSKESQSQPTKKALRHLQSELGLEFGAARSVNAISAEIDADLAEIKEAAQEMANTFLEVGEDAIGMVKDGISGVGSLFDGLWE